MTIKYNDPYGKREYAQLKGDKSDAFFKITFDEATLHKTDEGLIFYGNITDYQGVVRSFKPELPIESGVCVVPFYSQEYEARSKDKDGNWSSNKVQPSVFEKAICTFFLANENVYLAEGKAITGSISHLPDAMCQDVTEANLVPMVLGNSQLRAITATGKIPAFTPPASGNKGRSSWKSKAATMEEKVAFMIKQLQQDVKAEACKQEQSLGELVDRLIEEHSDNENFIQIYVDMLIACVR